MIAPSPCGNLKTVRRQAFSSQIPIRALDVASLPTLSGHLYSVVFLSFSHPHSWLIRTRCIAMSTPSNAPKLLLPFVKATQSTGTAHDSSTIMAPPELPLLSAYTAPQPRRRAKAPTKTREQWEAQRTNIYQLYIVEDLSLGEVMKAMDDIHNFKASYVAACHSMYLLDKFSSRLSRRIQYGSKLKEWGSRKISGGRICDS